jgi:large subunit ribosomal protein L7/L12
MAAADIKAIGDALAGLSIKDAAGVAAYLKDAYGIQAPATPALPSRLQGTVDCVMLPDPPATVDVVLTSAGDKKSSVIKVVRQISDLGLKQAKDLVDEVPSTVKSGVDRVEAEKIRAALVEQGATVELR